MSDSKTKDIARKLGAKTGAAARPQVDLNRLRPDKARARKREVNDLVARAGSEEVVAVAAAHAKPNGTKVR